MNEAQPEAPQTVPHDAQVVALGEAMAVFSGAPKPLAAGATLEFSFAGAESTVCIGLARLGHRVRWLSALGDDPFGRAIVKTLRGEGVDVEAVRVSNQAPTGVMFKLKRALSEPEVFYYRSTSAFARLDAESFAPDLWRGAKVLYLTGITPALSAGCRALWKNMARDAHAHGVKVWLDPNYRSKLWTREAARETLLSLMPVVDCVLPGTAEGEMLTGQTEPQSIARELMARGAKSVVVKAGAQGAFWFDAHTQDHAPPFAVERVMDPLGAGDGFASGLLSGVLDGLPPSEALRRAHAVGALVCGSEGDWEGLPQREELERFLDGQSESCR